MSNIINCPSCGRKLRVPPELAGQQVKCPSCNTLFEAAVAPATAPVPGGPEPRPTPPGPAEGYLNLSLDADDQSGSVREVAAPTEAVERQDRSGERTDREPAAADLEPCPYCGERIPADAARCRFCGEELPEAEDEDDRPWEQPGQMVRRDSEPHRGNLVLTLGILSVVLFGCSLLGLPLGIVAWVFGHKDLKKMRAQEMDPEGEGLTRAGFICGIVGTCLSSLCGLGCLAYFTLIGVMASSISRSMPPPQTFRAPPRSRPVMTLKQTARTPVGPQRPPDNLPPDRR